MTRQCSWLAASMLLVRLLRCYSWGESWSESWNTFFSNPSIASCGTASDVLSNVKFSMSPDPIVKGQPFTIIASGDLEDDFVSGVVDVDLQVSLLRVIDDRVLKTVAISLSPAVPKGPQKLQIGPVVLPTLPGAVLVKGRLSVATSDKQPVACIDLNLNVPALDESEVRSTPAQQEVSEPSLENTSVSVAGAAGGLKARAASRASSATTDVSPPTGLVNVANCGDTSDHMKDMKSTEDGGVTTMSAILDEALTKVSVDVDLSVRVLFVREPIRMTVPVSWTPGLPKGALKAMIGPSKGENKRASLCQQGSLRGGLCEAVDPAVHVQVTGTVRVDDAGDTEVACVSLGSVAGPLPTVLNV